MFSSNLSNLSEGVNTAFIVILSIILFFLVALTVVMIVFIIRYRESKNPVATQIHGNTTLEILWTIIPLLIVMAMFYYGWTAWKPMETDPPENAIHIETTARMWKWSFKYANGQRFDTLIIPVGIPVALDLNAIDVIHSIYIPAFRLKKDVVPGTPRTAWFVANSPGTYDLFCTEYCGLEHSSMITAIRVLTQEDFYKWYSADEPDTSSKAEKPSPIALGKDIVKSIGCNACHSTDGSKIVGPSFLGMFGKKEIVITNNKEREMTVDEEYIRRSILNPNADIVKGYGKNLMLSYEGQLSDEDIEMIIAYIKSIN